MTIDPNFLRGLPPFAALSVAERRLIAAAATHRFLVEDEHIFTQGEPVNDLFLALSGRIKLSRTSLTGAPVILRLVNPGDIFDLGRGMRSQRHTITASALRSSSIAVWPMRSWQQLVGQMPRLALGMVHIAGHALAETQDRFVEIATLDVPRRIAHAVLRLIDQAGREEEGCGIRIDFPLSQHDLAALTGTTLHTVSRILTRWESQGIITGGRRTLLVRDVPSLMHLATAADA